MQLVNLKIIDGEKTVREIKFKDGINIITNSEPDGNQIGKSTALRAINFCLGSDGKSLWQDPDSKTINTKIKKYVSSGTLTFILDIKVNGISYRIRRKIQEVEQKKRTIIKNYSWIDDADFSTNESFQEALAPILGFSTNSPTYSSIKNRFVRLDKNTSRNIYRYLHVQIPAKDYVPYYSFIFGFVGHEDLSKEFGLSKEKYDRETRIAALLNGKKEQEYKDKLQAIEDEIENLQNKEELFDFKGSQNKAIHELKAHRKAISKISSEISTLEVRVDYAKRTISNYKSKRSSVDVKLIAEIYAEARSIVPNLTKSLEDAISFHESIIEKKINYVDRQLDAHIIEVNEKEILLNRYLDAEKSLVKAISNESHLGGFLLIERELQEKKEEKGRASAVLNEVLEEANEIKKLTKKIGDLRNNNKLHLAQLKDKVEVLNVEFRKITRAVFKDFALSINADIDSSTNEINFSVVNEEKVDGDGAPRAAALAFDMALVEFSKITNANLPKFTLQDYLEPADEDKLAILCRLANKKKIQVVVSILHDKLQSLDDKFIKRNVVLWLSKSNKFLKV